MGAVLITGGAGYIGSHTAKALRAAGYEVVVLDNLVAGHRQAVIDAPFVDADVADTTAVRDTIRRHRVTAVMHFAALLSVAESVREPGRYYANNVSKTLALLGAMQLESVPVFVFSSSAAVYGNPLSTPIPETHPTQPINSYGETKLAIERALPHYENAYGLRAIRLRYFNAAGADVGGELGEDHDPEIHVIPRAIAAANGGARFEIYGDDYTTTDGTCVRDYVHVSDLAQAHVLALRALEAGGVSTAYNLGSGRPHSVRQVVATVERVTGRRITRVTSARRPGDPAVLVASSERIRGELGWLPQFEGLETIVETAWRWHSAHPNGYRSSGSKA